MQTLRWAISMLVGTASTSGAVAQASGCRPVDSVEVADRRAYLRLLISSRGKPWDELRALGDLQPASPEVVQLVTDPARCRRAAEAISRTREEPEQQRMVWLFALGSGYAAIDPGVQLGPEGRVPLYLLSAGFAYRTTLVVY